MLGLWWVRGCGGVMRHWELSFGWGKWSTDHHFWRIGKNELESLDIRHFFDDPRKRIFFEKIDAGGFRRSRSWPGRAGRFRTIPEISELDLLENSRKFLAGDENLLNSIDFHWKSMDFYWFPLLFIENIMVSNSKKLECDNMFKRCLRNDWDWFRNIHVLRF